MNMLANLTTDDSIAGEKDVLGGGGLFDSGIHAFTIEYAFLTQSDGGASALNLHLKGEQGRTLRAQIYFTSGKAKGGKNTYTDKDGQTQYLPGFLLADSLAQMTAGGPLNSLGDSVEEKVIKLYNFDAKAEVPTKVQMITAMLGKDIKAGVIKQIVDKNVKDANDKYVPSGETREENEIEKFFHAETNQTIAEAKAKEEAKFYKDWAEKWTGKVKNKAKGAGANAGTAGAPKAAGGAGNKPTTSLFGG